MDKSDMLLMLDVESRPNKNKGKKRKWREIEAIKDRYKLRKELEDIDLLHEYELDQIDI